jgi:hypothetical protein
MLRERRFSNDALVNLGPIRGLTMTGLLVLYAPAGLDEQVSQALSAAAYLSQGRELKRLGASTFAVEGRGQAYAVNLREMTCTCPIGIQGSMCQHLMVVLAEHGGMTVGLGDLFERNGLGELAESYPQARKHIQGLSPVDRTPLVAWLAALMMEQMSGAIQQLLMGLSRQAPRVRRLGRSQTYTVKCGPRDHRVDLDRPGCDCRASVANLWCEAMVIVLAGLQLAA